MLESPPLDTTLPPSAGAAVEDPAPRIRSRPRDAVFTLRSQPETSNIFLEMIRQNLTGVADWRFLTSHARVLLCMFCQVQLQLGTACHDDTHNRHQHAWTLMYSGGL